MNPALTTEEFNIYYKRYIELAWHMPVVEALQQGLQETPQFFSQIPVEKHDYRYSEGKWTPKEILIHIIDTERVFAYRALQFARSKNTVLPGYDQDEFIDNCELGDRTMSSLLEEFELVRKTSILLFDHLNDEELLRKGEASGSVLSVRAAGYIIAGHEKHHMAILKDRYLG